MKRVRFTEHELDIVMIMYSVAKAGAGDGDYEPWTDADWQALETLTDKVAILKLRIREKKKA